MLCALVIRDMIAADWSVGLFDQRSATIHETVIITLCRSATGTWADEEKDCNKNVKI